MLQLKCAWLELQVWALLLVPVALLLLRVGLLVELPLQFALQGLAMVLGVLVVKVSLPEGAAAGVHLSRHQYCPGVRASGGCVAYSDNGDQEPNCLNSTNICEERVA